MKIFIFLTFIQALILSSAAQTSFASTQKIADALGRMEVILTTKNKKPAVPVLTWLSLKNLEEKLYYTTAHDPAGLLVTDVPIKLRSSKLTDELMSEWYQLTSEAEFYGINDSVEEWTSLKKIFLTIINQRNQYLFSQSRKALKSGQLKKSIDDLTRYWSKKWYQENPKFTISYDLQQMNELKALVTASRAEAIKGLRAPASESSKYELSVFTTILLLIISSSFFYYLGKKFSSSTVKEIQEKPIPIKHFMSEGFDYVSWANDFSTVIEAFVREQETRVANIENFSDVANQLRELRVGIMLSTTEDEYLLLTQRLIDTGLKLEGLLNQKSVSGNSEVFDHVMNTVARLCAEIEKKQNIQMHIAA